LGFGALALWCPQLRNVNASSSNVTDVGIVQLATRCKLLERVDFSHTQVRREGGWGEEGRKEK